MKHSKSYMSVQAFCDKHHISPYTIYVGRSNGTIPEASCIGKGRGSLMIDEAYFKRRNDFKAKLVLQNHDYYYYLTHRMNKSELARILTAVEGKELTVNNVQKWITFMSSLMFREDSRSFIRTTITNKHWKFNRYASWIIQRSFRGAGVPRHKRDLLKIWENE